MKNSNTSRDPNELVIVVWKDPAHIVPEDEGPSDDIVGIRMGENNVSNDEHVFNSNATVLMRNRCVTWIFMIKKLG
jgi:hypothetical protein